MLSKPSKRQALSSSTLRTSHSDPTPSHGGILLPENGNTLVPSGICLVSSGCQESVVLPWLLSFILLNLSELLLLAHQRHPMNSPVLRRISLPEPRKASSLPCSSWLAESLQKVHEQWMTQQTV